MSTIIQPKSKTIKKTGNKPAHPKNPHPPAPLPSFSLRSCLLSFKRLLHQNHLKLALKKLDLSFYDSIFTPVVTLWYMIFQRLNPDHTLGAAVTDLHLGGADRLGPRNRPPLSVRIKSLATAALSKARQRLPLDVIACALSAQAQDIWKEAQGANWLGWRVLLLDGSQITLRPYPKILSRFKASSNQHGQAYWVLMRVVACFCLHTGVVFASACGCTSVSEQALACQLILQGGLEQCLYLGDRNFGIFWMAQCVQEAKAQCLFRLTQGRAQKLLGSRRKLRRAGDYRVNWSPSPHDLRRPGCSKQALPGRLIVAQYRPPGFRIQSLYLFTSLLDANTYSAQQLLELYALRWHIELDLRYLKTQMDLHQLECKSADMAEKEWLAGLMAYNLIRALMLAAALKNGIQPTMLSFCAARRLLVRWLLKPGSWTVLSHSWEKLLNLVAKIRQPLRSKPRPPEPRAKWHKRETFPPLHGSRQQARKNLVLPES
jgi:hypothetical protein